MIVALRRWHLPGLAELGYWIVERARGPGAATAAVREASRWLLGEARIERLQATVEPWNVASQHVLAANGFQREGLLRGYASWHDDERRDVYLYARLAAD